MKLNPKQELFCQEYLIDLNGTQAAIRAGYSKRTADVQASKLLALPKVASRVSQLKAERLKRVQVDQDYVLHGLMEVAERCMQKRPVTAWDYEKRQMGVAKDDEGREIWSFDSSGANRAFELLGKHVGIFEKDNKQKGQKITISRTK